MFQHLKTNIMKIILLLVSLASFAVSALCLDKYLDTSLAALLVLVFVNFAFGVYNLVSSLKLK
jgi:Zn-dependent protease